MAESVPVRCPACGREHRYTAPAFPCACGAPLAPPVLPGAPPEVVRHRRGTTRGYGCAARTCGRADQWPQPEFDCPCGALVRMPVEGERGGRRRPGAVRGPRGPHPLLRVRRPRRLTARPPFRPVTIRTARDALTRRPST